MLVSRCFEKRDCTFKKDVFEKKCFACVKMTVCFRASLSF